MAATPYNGKKALMKKNQNKKRARHENVRCCFYVLV